MAKLILISSILAFSSAGFGDQSEIPRTSWGTPDFDAVWDYRTATPLEAPVKLNGRVTFTEAEASTHEQTYVGDFLENLRRANPELAKVGVDTWIDPGQRLTEGNRAALVVDPPTGRLPRRTSAGSERATRFMQMMFAVPEGPEDRTVFERCLINPLVLPMRQYNAGNNNVRLVQTPDYIVISTEMIHDARIVPLNGEPPGDDEVRRWLGQSTGYWEGDTLIVETKNFREFVHPLGLSKDMHLVERFSLLDASKMTYEYTVTDPAVFETSWTARQTFARTTERMYEYACHEGNHSMALMLRGARMEESEYTAED